MRTFLRLYRVLAAGLMAAPLLADVNAAIRYLEEEVPKWKRENGCYSCHNNGDGARALMLLKGYGYKVSGEALKDTLEWLREPAKWEPKTLARVQFTATLRGAATVGLVGDGKALIAAADLLAADQSADGSWKIDEALVGAPATYGAFLATQVARASLEEIDRRRYANAIEKATKWFAANKPKSALDAAAHFAATGDKESLAILMGFQGKDGAWINEPFDTAVALIALSNAAPGEEIRERIARGRAWLLGKQVEAGGWPPTTRPAGGSSYAQHISTTAWAALALAATRERTE